MKLLFDENLSSRLLSELSSVFSDSQHVDQVGLQGQADMAVWQYAQQHGFAIVSKDDDFRQLSFLHGSPPKVIWLSVGNADTKAIAELLVQRRSAIETFIASSEESLFILRA